MRRWHGIREHCITRRFHHIRCYDMRWNKIKEFEKRHIYFVYPISISQLLLKSYELLRLMIIIGIWFSFWWQVAACTRTATKILVRSLGKKQSALRWPVVKKTNATSTTTLPRLPSLQHFPPRLIALLPSLQRFPLRLIALLPSLQRFPPRLTTLLREKSWEQPLYWQLVFHCSFKYFKTFLWQVSLRDKLAAFDLLHGV